MVYFLYLRSQRGNKEMFACTFQSHAAFSPVTAVGNYLHTPTNKHMSIHMCLRAYRTRERMKSFPNTLQSKLSKVTNSTREPSRMRKVIFPPNFIHCIIQLGYRCYTINRLVNALYIKDDVGIVLFYCYFCMCCLN